MRQGPAPKDLRLVDEKVDTAMDGRRIFDRLAAALCIVAAIAAVALNVATFLTTVRGAWLLPIFLASLVGAIGVMRRARSNWRVPERVLMWVGLGLFFYSVLLFVSFFRTAGWTSGVSLIEQQYVATYKNDIVRIITEHEYRMFPNLWVRAMSALIAMGSVFSLAELRGHTGD